MNIIIVDDERLVLLNLISQIGEACPQCNIKGFMDSDEALYHIRDNPIDIAFLDIEMPETNGLELAKQIKEIRPKTNIIFVTGYSKYAVDAHRLYVTGYLMKPTSKEEILLAMENLRNPIDTGGSRVKIRTFGGFEVFVDGKAVIFKRSKSKELLAYLVDRRGVTLTMPQIVAALWDDDDKESKRKNYLRKITAELISTLKEVNASYIVVKGFNTLAVDTSKFDCDYYDFLEWKISGINAYTCEYMPEYSWAEFTLAALERRIIEANRPLK